MLIKRHHLLSGIQKCNGFDYNYGFDLGGLLGSIEA